MALLRFKDKNSPSIKKDYVPNSVKIKRKYRIFLAISIVSNIILTTLLVNIYLN